MLPEGLAWCYIAFGLVALSPGAAFREFSHLKLLIDWSPKTGLSGGGNLNFFERAMQCSQNLQEFLPRSGALLV